MPTYRNDTSEEIFVEAFNNYTVNFKANQTLTSPYILSDSRITRTSDLPYYNPIAAAGTISVAAGGPTQTYYTNTDSKSLQLVPRAGAPRVFINSQYNEPAIVVAEAMTIENRGRIETLYIDNAGVVDCILDIKEII